MPEPLAAFAPRLCVEAGLLERGGSTQRDATVLFVDLAGFTPLTDRLGAVGSRGTEELSHLLRGFFGAVTDAVLERGGDPVAYGGDALTIVYDGPPNRTVRAALESAHAIQRLARATAGSPTAAGPVTLQARIGVARGPVTSAVAPATHRSIPVHLGAGLDRAVAAEGNARAGQVVLDPEAEETLLPNRHSEPASRPSPERVAASTSALARLVHPVTLGRLTEGRALLESHRSITVAFAHFPAVGSGELAAFLRTVGRLLELVDGLDGELVQVSGGDKGVVAMVVFGAPVAHSDDPLRSVQAMLELQTPATLGCGRDCYRSGVRRPSRVGTAPVCGALRSGRQHCSPAHAGRDSRSGARRDHDLAGDIRAPASRRSTSPEIGEGSRGAGRDPSRGELAARATPGGRACGSTPGWPTDRAGGYRTAARRPGRRHGPPPSACRRTRDWQEPAGPRKPPAGYYARHRGGGSRLR